MEEAKDVAELDASNRSRWIWIIHYANNLGHRWMLGPNSRLRLHKRIASSTSHRWLPGLDTHGYLVERFYLFRLQGIQIPLETGYLDVQTSVKTLPCIQ